jgi:hypothetical protein
VKTTARIACALLLGTCWLHAQTAVPGTTAPSAATTARSANAAATSETFSAAVANDLLSQLAEGMESRNSRMALAAFDAGRLSGYQRFADQMDAWFHQNSSFRVYYKVKQTSTESARGIALVEFEYEATPSAEGTSPLRRRTQMRFSFERGAKGWKIVDFSPRSLFS